MRAMNRWVRVSLSDFSKSVQKPRVKKTCDVWPTMWAKRHGDPGPPGSNLHPKTDFFGKSALWGGKCKFRWKLALLGENGVAAAPWRQTYIIPMVFGDFWRSESGKVENLGNFTRNH